MLPNCLQGVWPDQYFKSIFRQENSTLFWQVGLFFVFEPNIYCAHAVAASTAALPVPSWWGTKPQLDTADAAKQASAATNQGSGAACSARAVNPAPGTLLPAQVSVTKRESWEEAQWAKSGKTGEGGQAPSSGMEARRHTVATGAGLRGQGLPTTCTRRGCG